MKKAPKAQTPFGSLFVFMSLLYTDLAQHASRCTKLFLPFNLQFQDVHALNAFHIFPSFCIDADCVSFGYEHRSVQGCAVF